MNNTLFFHGKTIEGRRFTVAGTFVDGEMKSTGISLCSKNDQFVIKLGRMKADGRMHASAKLRIQLPRGQRSHKLVKANNGKEIKVFTQVSKRLESLPVSKVQKLYNL